MASVPGLPLTGTIMSLSCMTSLKATLNEQYYWSGARSCVKFEAERRQIRVERCSLEYFFNWEALLDSEFVA